MVGFQELPMVDFTNINMKNIITVKGLPFGIGCGKFLIKNGYEIAFKSSSL